MASGGVGQSEDGRTPLSQDFAWQIRQLEKEGSKLMNATQSLQSTMLSPSGKSMSKGTLRVSSPLMVAPGLSALTDITEEQQTISRLSESLDASTRETENLRQHLRGSQPAPYSSSLTSRYNPNLLSSLEVPDSSYHVNYTSTSPRPRLGPDYSNLPGLESHLDTAKTYGESASHSHLERKIREAKEEAADYKTKVREAIRIAEEQKNQFRVSIDELKTQLHQSVRDKENILMTKTKELKGHEATIQRQQNNITQLEQANKIQEETLLEMNGKLEALQHDHYAMDALFAQVRTMILDREQKRGRPFYERESTSKQSPSVLAHSLERCLQELEFEITEKARKLSQVSIELEEYKASWREKQQLMSQEQQDQISQQKDHHSRELKSANEHLQAARRQVASLQDELVSIKDEYSANLKEKKDLIRKNRSEWEKAIEEKDDEIAKWKEKMSAMELTIDQIEKEITFCRCEKEDAVKRLTAAESKFDELKETIMKLESLLAVENEKSRKLADRECDAKKQLEITVAHLESKSKEVGELKESMAAMRREFDQQMQNTLRSLNEEQKEKSSQRLIDMSRQLADAMEKYQNSKLELEVLKAEHRNLTEQHQQVVKQNEAMSSQLQEIKVVKENLSSTLQEKLADVERLTQEKDTYFKLLGEKEKELLVTRGDTEKLQIQLEDKLVQLKQFSEQQNKTNEFNKSLEDQLKKSHGDLDNLTQNIHQLQLEKQEILNSRDNIIKRLKLREKHLKDLEEDNQQMAAQISEFKEEVEVLKKEKTLSDNELANLQKTYKEIQSAKKKVEKSLTHEHDGHKREIKKLNAKLQGVEDELKLAQKALKTQKEVDGRAVKVAGKMQKEVTEKRSQIDTLNTKVRWLEESLDNILKSKEGAAEQIDALTDKLTSSKQQQEKLKHEIEEMHKHNSHLRDQVAKMEGALEKAAVKHSETKSQLENYQQEVARLKLKHQLEIKEYSRNGQAKSNDIRKSYLPDVNLAAPKHYPKHSPKYYDADTEDTPVKEQPVHTQVQNYMDNGVGHELRSLLSEMRDMLLEQKNQQAVSPRLERIPGPSGSRNLEESVDYKYDEVNRSSNNNSQKNRQHTTMTPVAPFYGEDSISVSEITEDKDYNDPDLIKPTMTVSNSEELYKRLEGRIADLAEMGSHLQRENIEIHDIIQSSGEKLDKLKHREKKS